MILTIVSRCLTIIAVCYWATATASSLYHQAPGDQKQNRERSSGKSIEPEPSLLSDEEIAEARKRLEQLGYWIRTDVTDPEEARKDSSFRHAMIAFQKVECRPLTGSLTSEELIALRAAQKPRALEQGIPHIEVDLSRQILFLVNCAGADLKVLPVSSGSGELFTEGGITRRAITPAGRFKIYRKIEKWRKSPLGLLYYPNYINEGVAIHGAPSVPPYPASHGCIRIPMFAAREFSAMTPLGLPVIVYDQLSLEIFDMEYLLQSSHSSESSSGRKN